MLVGMLMVVAIVAGILTARAEGEGVPKSQMEWAQTVAYWVFTIAVAFEMVAGGIWDLLGIEFVRVSLNRLGYPLYLLYILGPPKILCATVLLVPRFPRLKEWTYAGAVISYMGAAASLWFTGRHFGEWLAPLAFAGLTMGSWGLRPTHRKLIAVESTGRVRVIAWGMPILVMAAMAALAVLTLPTSAQQH